MVETLALRRASGYIFSLARSEGPRRMGRLSGWWAESDGLVLVVGLGKRLRRVVYLSPCYSSRADQGTDAHAWKLLVLEQRPERPNKRWTTPTVHRSGALYRAWSHSSNGAPSTMARISHGPLGRHDEWARDERQ